MAAIEKGKGADKGRKGGKTLVIFDYSGTLSLEAPEFARPGKLLAALAESGLADFGVAAVETFWERIVFPTWEEGSRTKAGYARVIARRVEELAARSEGEKSDIEQAAARFVEMYMNHSRIDPLWLPLLARLIREEGVAVVIATDHYAEATGAIVRHLYEAGIDARPAIGRTDGHAVSVIVANSADLGFWKAERRFWELLQGRLHSNSFGLVMLVDDFGFNEADENGYAVLALVRARQEKTAAALREVFAAEVEMVPFFLEKAARTSPELRVRAIGEAVRKIARRSCLAPK